jgi:hypothetical protein
MKTKLHGQNPVCKLKKSLYGLKQASRQWNKELNTCLKDIGFIRLYTEVCWYYLKTENYEIHILVYVDDLIVAGNNQTEIFSIKEKLMSSFDMKDLGKLKHILGMHVEISKNGYIYINQQRYIQEQIEFFGQQNSKGTNSPIESEIEENNNYYPDNTAYRGIIGRLMHIAKCTRPDISYAINYLSRFQIKPTYAHWNACIKVVKYLKTTKYYKLQLGGESLTIEAYSDANYKRNGEKCTSGIIVKLGTGIVQWRSVKQSTISESTTEAVYYALNLGLKESLHVRNILEETDKFTNNTKNYTI